MSDVKVKKIKKVKNDRQKFKEVLKNNQFALGFIFKRCRWYIPVVLFCAIVGETFMFLEHSWVIMYITDSIQYGRDFNSVLITVGSITLGLTAFHIFGGFLWNLWMPRMDEKLERTIKADVFKKAREMDLERYDNPDFYNDYIWSLNNIVPQAKKAVDNIRMIFSGLANLAFSGLMFALYDKWGLVFATVSTLASFLINFRQKKIEFNLENERTPHIRKRNYLKRIFFLNDYAKDLRIYNIKEKFLKQYEGANTGIIKATKKYSRAQIILGTISGFVFRTFILNGLYLAYLIYMATQGRISYGQVFVLLRAAGWQFSSGVSQLIDCIPEFSGNSRYIGKFRTFLSTENKISDNGTLELGNEPCEIKLKDVCFSYGNNELDFVLKNVNMTIKPKEKVAIVGYNGAGKTTLTKLLMRFYEPTSGTIEIDGKDIKEYKLASLRSKIGVLFQDFQLLAASVKENVAMDVVSDNPNNDEKIKTALIRSGFKEKLDTFDKGLDTVITKEFDENGVYLSGGESQKLAMARLLFKDSAFAILDEPSSALDPISEYNVNKIMLEESASKTVIFISHRMSTAKIADTVYFFENGQIAEHGTHDTLMSAKGKYSQLYELQAKKYRLSS